jgi:hypothetical protein
MAPAASDTRVAKPDQLTQLLFVMDIGVRAG